MRKILVYVCMLAFMTLIVSGCGSNKKAASEQIRIAAAASLEKVFNEKLIPAFNKQYPDIKVEGVYDSSGKLQMQIENGLDADIFFSAAEKQMKELDKKGFMDSKKIQPLLANKLVLIVNKDSKLNFTKFTDIALAARPAIGDPQSVPAGQYAKEALSKLNIWDSVKDKASLGTNVTEVLNWVAEGSAEAGIVYATDAARNDKVKIIAKLDEGVLSKEVIYPVGVLKKSADKKAAIAFYEFLQSKQAAEIFKDYGFETAK